MHILSPETDNCPSWISGRERITVENISWSISTKECCRPRWGLNPRPPGLESDGASNWATEAGSSSNNKEWQLQPLMKMNYSSRACFTGLFIWTPYNLIYLTHTHTHTQRPDIKYKLRHTYTYFSWSLSNYFVTVNTSMFCYYVWFQPKQISLHCYRAAWTHSMDEQGRKWEWVSGRRKIMHCIHSWLYQGRWAQVWTDLNHLRGETRSGRVSLLGDCSQVARYGYIDWLAHYLY